MRHTVKFGSGSTNYNWENFFRLKTLKEIQTQAFNGASQDDLAALAKRVEFLEMKTAPIQNGGVIFSWGKKASEIPDGWKECSDTQGKMLIHLDPNNEELSTLGAFGGKTAIVQTKEQMAKHSHRFRRIGIGSEGGSRWGWIAAGPDEAGSNGTIDIYTTEEGKSEPMNILNPYRIVLFIEPNFQ